jgi:formate hydrogenlyase subunit 3/multisubunit Na+/H+ antiporter MnhD subunit
MPAPQLVFDLPLPLEEFGMTPFGGLLLVLVVASGILTSLYLLRTSGWSSQFTLVVFFTIIAALLFIADNLLLFFLLWLVGALVAWGIGQNALGQEDEGTGVLFLQLAGWLAIVAVGVCLLMLLLNSANNFSLSELSAGGVEWAAFVLPLALLLMTSALVGCAWRSGRQPLAAAAGGYLMTAGVFVMCVYPFARLVLGIFGSQLDWREAVVLVGLLGASALALAALGEDDNPRILSYVSFAQILLLSVGLAMPNRQGLTAAVLILVVYAFSCPTLYLALGMAEEGAAEDRLTALGGTAPVSPVGATVFAVAGLALVGLPPVGSYIGQMLLASTLLRLDALWPAAAFGVAMGLSILCLFRLFARVYLSSGGAPYRRAPGTRPRRLALAALLPLVFATVLAAVAPFWGPGVVEPVVSYLLR